MFKHLNKLFFSPCLSLLFLFAFNFCTSHTAIAQQNVNYDSLKQERQRILDSNRTAQKRILDSTKLARSNYNDSVKAVRKALTDSLSSVRAYRESKHIDIHNKFDNRPDSDLLRVSDMI